MKKTEKTLEALVAFVLAEDTHAQLAARQELERLAHGIVSEKKDPERMVRNFLMEIGAPDHLIGHEYIVSSILLIIEDRKYINNVVSLLYPTVALRFDTTAPRVERAIRHVIEVIWNRADYEILSHYFGNIVSPEKGKTTNSEFLARVANIVKMEMQH